MDSAREKILEASRELFLSCGYRKTTTRQILEKAGVKNGTLYHFFKGKEHIFMHLAEGLFDEASKVVEELSGKSKDPLLQYAIAMNLEFYAVARHERLAELFSEAYRSWQIMGLLVQKGARKNAQLFGRFNPGFKEADYHIRTLAIKGSIAGFISEQYHEGRISRLEKTAAILSLAASLFNVPNADIKSAVERSDRIIRDKKIVISGFTI